MPCFALTSPEAGSDAGGIPDFGIVCAGEWQGKKDVLGIRLTWEKRYITLGPIATLLGLAFRLYDPDHILGPQEDRGITLGLIPTDTSGVNIGRRHFPLNGAFMNGPNWGKDVFVPWACPSSQPAPRVAMAACARNSRCPLAALKVSRKRWRASAAIFI